MLLKLLATDQWVEQLFPSNNPEDARKKAPVQIVAISAPSLYCFAIHSINFSLPFTDFI